MVGGEVSFPVGPHLGFQMQQIRKKKKKKNPPHLVAVAQLWID